MWNGLKLKTEDPIEGRDEQSSFDSQSVSLETTGRWPSAGQGIIDRHGKSCKMEEINDRRKWKEEGRSRMVGLG